MTEHTKKLYRLCAESFAQKDWHKLSSKEQEIVTLVVEDGFLSKTHEPHGGFVGAALDPDKPLVKRTPEQKKAEESFRKAGHQPEHPQCDHSQYDSKKHGRYCPCGTCMWDAGD